MLVFVHSKVLDRRVQRRDERVQQFERALPTIVSGKLGYLTLSGILCTLGISVRSELFDCCVQTFFHEFERALPPIVLGYRGTSLIKNKPAP